MRCVACDSILSEEDMTPDKPATQSMEDLCHKCRIALDLAEQEGYDPRFKQWEGLRSGLQGPKKGSDC